MTDSNNDYNHNDDYYENDIVGNQKPTIGDIVELNSKVYKVTIILEKWNGLELVITNDIDDNIDFEEMETFEINPYQVKFIMSKEEYNLKNKIDNF